MQNTATPSFPTAIGRRLLGGLDKRLPPIPDEMIFGYVLVLFTLYFVADILLGVSGWAMGAWVGVLVVPSLLLLIRNVLFEEDAPENVCTQSEKCPARQSTAFGRLTVVFAGALIGASMRLIIKRFLRAGYTPNNV